jgi:phage terminase small subunit
MPGMTAKQLRFVEEYLVDLNASAAAKRAGYSDKTSDSIGFSLLRKIEIQQAIQSKRLERSAKTGITAERVIREIARVAFADPRDVMMWGEGGVTLRDSASLTDDQAAAVMEVSQTVSQAGGSLKVKMHNKVEALEKLARHVGLYDKTQEDDSEAINALAVSVRRKLGIE